MRAMGLLTGILLYLSAAETGLERAGLTSVSKFDTTFSRDKDAPLARRRLPLCLAHVPGGSFSTLFGPCLFLPPPGPHRQTLCTTLGAVMAGGVAALPPSLPTHRRFNPNRFWAKTGVLACTPSFFDRSRRIARSGKMSASSVLVSSLRATATQTAPKPAATPPSLRESTPLARYSFPLPVTSSLAPSSATTTLSAAGLNNS